MCLNDTYIYVCVSKYLSDSFPILHGLIQGDVLSPLLFNFVLILTLGKSKVNQMRLKINGTHQLLAYVDDVNLLEESIDTVKRNTEMLNDASKEVGLEINVEKLSIYCYLITRIQVKIGRKSSK
jgi:hypothetical protein